MVLSRKLIRMIGVRAWVLCGVLCRKLRQEISKLRPMIGVWDWGMVTEKIQQIGKHSVKLVIVNTFISSSSTRMSITSFVSKPSTISQLNVISQLNSNISGFYSNFNKYYSCKDLFFICDLLYL